MTTALDLNPALCELAEDELDDVRRNLILAFLPNLGAPLVGGDVERKTLLLVDAALDALRKPLGPWDIVWGPGVFQLVPGAVPANTMFVARHRHSHELFVGIAGTNPFSVYAWFAYDFDVDEARAWGTGKPPEGAAVSKGTLRGLRALQGMVPPPELPGGNTPLARFLASLLDREGDPVDVTVGGHSLGGALAPALALWLLDTREAWDPHDRARLSVYAYAGPTPGNAGFAEAVESGLGDRLHRIANPLDVVTRAWRVPDLAEVKALYAPDIARDPLWDAAVDVVIQASNGIPYRHVDASPLILKGRVNRELVWRFAPKLANYVGQVLYQHTLAYFELLGLPSPETSPVLGRRLAHESGAVASAILERAGIGPWAARLLGLGLRVAAETWSRLPLLPSPVPETRASTGPRAD